MISWLWKIIPSDYKFSVAIKKVSYMAGKLVAGYLTAQLVTKGRLTPDQCTQIQLGVTTLVAGGLETIHDWAKLKWPDNKWL